MRKKRSIKELQKKEEWGPQKHGRICDTRAMQCECRGPPNRCLGFRRRGAWWNGRACSCCISPRRPECPLRRPCACWDRCSPFPCRHGGPWRARCGPPWWGCWRSESDGGRALRTRSCPRCCCTREATRRHPCQRCSSPVSSPPCPPPGTSPRTYDIPGSDPCLLYPAFSFFLSVV